MPGTSETPAVTVSYPASWELTLAVANNFWGKEDAGVQPLFERMHSAKVTSDEVKAFYSARATIEDEYARKLLGLCRKPLGSSEAGTLRASLDTLRGEVESMGKAHQNIAAQMKSELEEPLAAHAGGMKERRKIVQSGIEKLLKLKIQQTQTVNKSRDRYEQDCLRIKGYLAQGHMVMGQEERKNKAKLEKTQIHLATSNTEYENAVKALEETTVRWNREWKAACDVSYFVVQSRIANTLDMEAEKVLQKFQDLEEERLDFMKSSLWAFANIASTVCVSDDASCEKIRLSLEECDVEKDINTFIRDRGTGQEIPDAPKYINFCRGDINDNQSETSEEDGYSVAQFQRTINPAFRTSSPQPSTYESHHDPQSRLGLQMSNQYQDTPPSRETTMTPQKLVQPNGRFPPPEPQAQPAGQFAIRHGQHEQLPTVPHNEYPMDGMTMYCRTAPPSERSSVTSPVRPSSRDSQSEYSNPTSFSSQEPPSGKQSPTKQMPILPGPGTPADNKQVQKKKSGFFQNHSPFRRKSKHDRDDRTADLTPTPGRNGWNVRAGGAVQESPMRRPQMGRPNSHALVLGADRRTESPEPADPRAQFQLNVGNNVFDVASPDARKKGSAQRQNDSAQEELDPIAQALAELKGVGKQASVRMSADRYHGLQTPAPSSVTGPSTPVPTINHASSTTQRGTPPPSYDQPAKKLDLPQPAFTSAQMQQTRQKYLDQRQSMFGDSATMSNSTQRAINTRSQSRPGTRGSGEAQSVPRATSPAPPRSVSPRPAINGGQRQGYHSVSPDPYSRSAAQRQSHSLSPTKRDPEHGYFPGQQNGRPAAHARRNSMDPGNNQLQLSRPVNNSSSQDSQQHQRGRYGGANDRPMTFYGGGSQAQSQNSYAVQPHRPRADSRVGSRSRQDGQLTSDGRPILHHARALYMYQAAIPEELSFAKGDILAVIRHQDDGWWEAEVVGKRSGPGLVPSNYLQPC
ncbi:MAG: hypothetical protein M1816_001549 [Peltula sp. TS41687]|nr:MAG: hypothetical protein M1816_001549 [Peltula sp. TS41687]